MKPLQLQATIDGVSTRKDHSMGIRLSTQELLPDEMTELMGRVNQFGWVLFAPEPMSEESIPKAKPSDETKSPSQRLRAAIFVLWKQRGEVGDFDAFYRAMMERAINRVKERLD